MPTIKHKIAFKEVVKGSSLTKAMVVAGYSPTTSKRTNKLTRTKGWEKLTEQYLNDKDVAKRHNELLNSHYIDHMVFPLNVTDEDIIELLNEVNCVARRFMHSETQTHVWFWSPDNKARKDAIDMVYKLKGRYEDKGDSTRPVTVNIPIQLAQSFNINGTDTKTSGSNTEQREIQGS